VVKFSKNTLKSTVGFKSLLYYLNSQVRLGSVSCGSEVYDMVGFGCTGFGADCSALIRFGSVGTGLVWSN
jgi:hypothetical protein